MTEKSKYKVPEEAKDFINRALGDGVGESIRRLAKQSKHSDSAVGGWERHEQVLFKAASGMSFDQIAEETGIKGPQKVNEQYRQGRGYA